MAFDIYRLQRGGKEVFLTGQSTIEFADVFLPKLAAAGLEVPETEYSTLCHRCAAVTLSKLKESEGYMLLDDVSLLESSAEKCDMCQLVLIALRTSALGLQSKDPDLNNPASLCEHLELESGAAPVSVYLTLEGAALRIRIEGGRYHGFHPSLKVHAQLGKTYVIASNT